MRPFFKSLMNDFIDFIEQPCSECISPCGVFRINRCYCSVFLVQPELINCLQFKSNAGEATIDSGEATIDSVYKVVKFRSRPSTFYPVEFCFYFIILIVLKYILKVAQSDRKLCIVASLTMQTTFAR